MAKLAVDQFAAARRVYRLALDLIYAADVGVGWVHAVGTADRVSGVVRY